jgi:hypothetical protein
VIGRFFHQQLRGGRAHWRPPRPTVLMKVIPKLEANPAKAERHVMAAVDSVSDCLRFKRSTVDAISQNRLPRMMECQFKCP